MYTARTLPFTITWRQEMHNICSQKLFLKKGLWSPQRWPFSHLETTVLISHSDSLWQYGWLMSEYCLSVYVYIRQKIERKSNTVNLCVCVCKYVEGKFHIKTSRLCSQLSGTSQLFDLLNFEGNLGATHSADTLLYSDNRKRSYRVSRHIHHLMLTVNPS